LPATTEYWHKHKQGKFGLYRICKTCKAKYKKSYDEINKDKISKYRKEWAKKNKDMVRQYYLNSINETEESLKKKKQVTEFRQRRRNLLNQAIKAESVTNLFGLKKCTKCGVEKPDNSDFFHKNKSSKNGLHRWCKECVNKNRKKNIIKPVKIVDRVYKDLLLYEELREHPEKPGIAQCKCSYCGKWIAISYRQATLRLKALDHISAGENRIYCPGDQCRQACPIYGQHLYPKGFKKNSSREVDPLVRHMCFSRDNYTCQKCGATGDGATLHAHHILSYAKNKIVANDIQNVITLCKSCHNEVHHMDGCKYYELRCG